MQEEWPSRIYTAKQMIPDMFFYVLKKKNTKEYIQEYYKACQNTVMRQYKYNIKQQDIIHI